MSTSVIESKDKIFDLLKESKIADAIQYINENKLEKIDCVDEHGTTALQYAVKIYSFLILFIQSFRKILA